MREGWEYKKLGEVATFVNGYAFKPSQWSEKGIPIIRIQNLNTPDAIFNYFEGEIPQKYHVKKGDILISWSASLGAYEWKGNDAYLNQHIFKVVFDKLEIDKHYLKYAVISKLSDMEKEAHGATMRHIVKKDFDNTLIPFVSLTKQQQIVEELDLLSSIIEKKKEQLNELDNLAQSIFYDMFGDPVTNEKGWKISPFKNIATFKNGLNYHPTDNGTIIKCIGVGDFQNRKELRDFGILKDLSIDETIDEDYYLKDGDILIVRSNGSRELVGRNMIVYPNNQKITYSGFCIRCRISIPDILPIILNRILSSRSTMIILRQEGRGCNISNINQKILSSLPVILPPLPLQQQFASKIEAIEQQKELIKQSIKEVETLFNSRMDYYFN